MAVSVIRNAAMVIGWESGGHRYLPDADVAFENGAITFVGRDYTGQADTIIGVAELVLVDLRVTG